MKRREAAEAEERARREREEAERRAAIEAASRPKEPEPSSSDRPDTGAVPVEERSGINQHHPVYIFLVCTK